MRGRGRGFLRGGGGYPSGYGMPPRAAASDYMGGLGYSRASSYLGGPPPLSRRPSYGSAREYSADARDRYSGRLPSSYPEKVSAYERDRYSSHVDYYEKYRAQPYGSSYFEERRLGYIPPLPSSSLSRLSSSVDPYERRPLPPSSAAASYYLRDRSPIRRVPVTSDSYGYERSRLSPVSSSRSSSYAVPQARDPYTDRTRYAY